MSRKVCPTLCLCASRTSKPMSPRQMGFAAFVLCHNYKSKYVGTRSLEVVLIQLLSKEGTRNACASRQWKKACTAPMHSGLIIRISNVHTSRTELESWSTRTYPPASLNSATGPTKAAQSFGFCTRCTRTSSADGRLHHSLAWMRAHSGEPRRSSTMHVETQAPFHARGYSTY